MPHSYVTVTTVKGTGVLNLTGTAYDTRLRILIEDISRQVDRFTNRTFQAYSGTFYYDGDGGTFLHVKDVVSVTSLKEDTNQDGTFETTWDAKDYFLLPHNAQPTEDWGRAYVTLQVSPKSDGTQDAFLKGPKRYEIVGTFGYVAVTRDSGVNTSGSWNSTTTTLDISSTGTIEPGMSILVDSERMYVESASGTTISVVRKALGSTAGTHATTVDINYYQHPGPVVEACLIQAARLWRRRDSGFALEIGIPDLGSIPVRTGLDRDVQELLWPYRRLHV